MTQFNLEMRAGQTDDNHRVVDADRFTSDEVSGWLIFYRNPPQGGIKEYWRVRLDAVVSMETK